MKANRFDCRECAQPERNGAFSGRNVYVHYYFTAPNAVYFEISWMRGYFGDGEERIAARLKEALKAEFTARFQGLEAVEPLRDRYHPAPPPCRDEATPGPRCTATGQPTPTGAPL